MSILPLVFAFIVIFSISTYSLLQDVRSCRYEKSIYISFLKTRRSLQIEVQKLLFKEAGKKDNASSSQKNRKGKKEKQQEETEIPSANQNYYSPRDNETLHQLAKLNIGQLLVADARQVSSLLYETAAKLIRLLYEKTTVYEPDLEYQILNLLMKAAKENPSELKLENLAASILTDSKNKSLYKIFKGTSSYTLFTKEGYPPLADFISIDFYKNKKPINFHYAPRVLLVALFGEQITLQVIEAEKKKWEKPRKHSSLTDKEFESLLLNDPEKKLSFSMVEPLINFNQRTEKNQHVTVKDSKSGISLKTKL